jgi:hypothetical protein
LLLILCAWGLISVVRSTHRASTASTPSVAEVDPPWPSSATAPSIAAGAVAKESPAPPATPREVNEPPAPAASVVAHDEPTSIRIPPMNSAAPHNAGAASKRSPGEGAAMRAASAGPTRKAPVTKNPYDLENFGGRR